MLAPVIPVLCIKRVKTKNANSEHTCYVHDERGYRQKVACSVVKKKLLNLLVKFRDKNNLLLILKGANIEC
jgi:hypothetical protein